MAKANYVSYYGQVLQNPQIKADKEGKLVQASMIAKVIRRFVDENKRLEFSTPMIVTANQDVAHDMISMRKGDMVLVKGVITTLNISRTWYCECGYVNSPAGSYTITTPIFIKKMEGLADAYEMSSDKDQMLESEGIKLLKEQNEISNIVHVVGTVCNIQGFYENEKGFATFTFQIAVNRRFRLAEGDPTIRTDYPWVKVYGDAAREAKEVLDINSTVFIDGSLFTKTVIKKEYCEQCGKEHDQVELVSEIHPYAIEYLHNCNIPEKSYLE